MSDNSLVKFDPNSPVEYSVGQKITDIAEQAKTVPAVVDEPSRKKARSFLYQSKQVKGEIERQRKAMKAAALEYGRVVDSTAKEIQAKLEEAISPVQVSCDAYEEKLRLEEERKQRELEELQQARRAEIDWLHDCQQEAHRFGTTAAHVQGVIDRVEARPPKVDMGDDLEGYLAERDTLLDSLLELKVNLEKKEQEEREMAEVRKKQQAEAEALKKKQEEIERRERELQERQEVQERAEREAREAEARKAAEKERAERERLQREAEESRRKAAEEAARLAEEKRKAEEAARVAAEREKALSEPLGYAVEALKAIRDRSKTVEQARKIAGDALNMMGDTSKDPAPAPHGGAQF